MPVCLSEVLLKPGCEPTGLRQELILRVSWSVELEAQGAEPRDSCQAGNASGIPGSGKRARVVDEFSPKELSGRLSSGS